MTPQATTLLLVRHGRSTWNAVGRIQGQADPPLDDVGREQARLVGERLRRYRPQAVYASPLRRAYETAEIIADCLNLPVIPDDRLQEYDLGVVSGLTWEEIQEHHPAIAARWRGGSGEAEIPGEEGHQVFRERVLAIFDEIVTRHSGETVCVVSHGGTQGMYFNHLLGLGGRLSPFRFSNGSLTIVEVGGPRLRIEVVNDTCHLKGGEE